MSQIKRITLLIILFVSYINSYSQGCSDAGVCTINNIKDHSLNISSETGDKNYFKSGISYGIGEYDIAIVNPYLEYTGLISEKISLSGKLTYAFIFGELANTSNLADFIVSSSFTLLNNEHNFINAIVGLKIPLSNSSIMEEGNSLPMHYQSSLGTYDLIVGTNYSFSNLGVSIALQQPIVNSNKNEFLKPGDQNLKEFKYPSTNSYERKGDLVLRTSYNLNLIKNRFAIRPGLLAIYHLADDSYIDQSNIEQEIIGSKGLTVNGNIFINYMFSESRQLEFSVGSPFITRDSRPDGLTRKIVVGLEYVYSF